jgi:hypothetical protein
VQAKLGYRKILYASRQAIADGYRYLWIDTCCIDKSSSTELSEAINSMFQWYQKAGVCYAYVEDVQLENFSTSRWFTRGWTLQELLAPSDVMFFGIGWTRLGTKFDLYGEISKVTGIEWEVLINEDFLRKKSIAQRMSWASKRKTTRLEDAAYCLLGIFGVNMPLLYGEGKNAFIRLQEEILKSSVDQSLFAWSIASDSNTHRGGCGIFAQSPENYRDSSSIVSFQRSTDTTPYVMTNKGLQIELPLIEAPGYVLGLLDCQFHDATSTCLAILLQRTHTSDVFFRTQGTTLGEAPVAGGGLETVTHEQASRAIARRIYIPKDAYEVHPGRSSYQIIFPTLQEHGYQLVARRPNTRNANVRWNDLAKSLHITHDTFSSLRCFAFVFHNARTKWAFAVYFDEATSINAEGAAPIEGMPIEEISIDVWLSPPVHEPAGLSHLYTLQDWWHSLSYGIDYFGVAYERHPAIWFRAFDGDGEGIPGTFIISTRLETANRFGQKVGVLHVSWSTSASPLAEGKYSPSGVWEPSSLSDLWRKYPRGVIGPTSHPSNPPGPSKIIKESYSTLEVVPPSLPNIHPGLSAESGNARPPNPVMPPAKQKKPAFFLRFH